MTPLQFEQGYRADWDRLDELLRAINAEGRERRRAKDVMRAGQIVQLYRRCCEQLALARSRDYPVALVDRLEYLTASAHQLIYQRREWGWWRLREFLLAGLPRAVRKLGPALWVSLAVFLLPALVLGPLVYFHPELVYSVMSPEDASRMEDMYSIDAESLGRLRTAETDWTMFGFYIQHNIGIAFQCYASGLFIGIGSLFALFYNSLLLGAVAGFLTERGLSGTFYPFVATHSAFELTAVVLSGAAGLRLGQALLAPGRRSRVDALVFAVKESIPVIYGVTLLLLIAAAIEAFWSSSVWLPVTIKYSVAAACWLAVISYFSLQGRRAA